MKIMAIGEIIFDIFNGEAKIGGAPLNFCAHCSMLGVESALVSAVGKDELAMEAISHLKCFGVSTAFVSKNDYPTGQCIVTVNNGNPSYNVIRPSAYDKIEITDDVINKINEYNADVFAFGTLIQRDMKSREAVTKILSKCKFSRVFCDVNLRPDCYDRDSCLLCLKNADIIKISEEEEPVLSKFALYHVGKTERETIKNICKAFENIKFVLFTKGENGSIIYDAVNDKYFEIPCIEANVVSTVGAGDSYSAAFLCEFFRSGDVFKAGMAGANLSAFVVSHKEAVPKK